MWRRPLPRLSGFREKLADQWAQDFGIRRDGPIFKDERLWRLVELSTDLAMLRDPVAGTLTIVVLTGMTPLIAAVYGAVIFRTSFRKARETLLMLITVQNDAAHHWSRRNSWPA